MSLRRRKQVCPVYIEAVPMILNGVVLVEVLAVGIHECEVGS